MCSFFLYGILNGRSERIGTSKVNLLELERVQTLSFFSVTVCEANSCF
jgi:hypothetical protein